MQLAMVSGCSPADKWPRSPIYFADCACVPLAERFTSCSDKRIGRTEIESICWNDQHERKRLDEAYASPLDLAHCDLPRSWLRYSALEPQGVPSIDGLRLRRATRSPAEVFAP